MAGPKLETSEVKTIERLSVDLVRFTEHLDRLLDEVAANTQR